MNSSSPNRNKAESIKGINRCGNECIVCGWNRRSSKTGSVIVEGAHVRPFDTGAEYDTAENIIALCPNHHSEYDELNFYIDPDSRLLHFRYQNAEYEGKDVSTKTKHIKKAYLIYAKYLYDSLIVKE